jgi:hypothetical protein
MYIRKQVRNTIESVKRYHADNMISKADCERLIEKLKNFNFEHRGYSRYDFTYHFIFWCKWNIYDVIEEKRAERLFSDN